MINTLKKEAQILPRLELEDLVQKFVAQHNLNAYWGKDYEGVCTINFSVKEDEGDLK